MGSTQSNVGAACFCVAFIVGLILFAVSFDTLEPTEVGIRYNNNIKSIEYKVYNNGRYFVGLGQHFIKFPTEMQLVEFIGGGEDGQLDSWSFEGQQVLMDISFMYQLRRDKVLEIYSKYLSNYDDIIRKIAVETLKQVSIEFTTDQFFLNRTMIADAMRVGLSQRLKQEYIDMNFFNLRAIDLPNPFEDQIVAKVVQAQQVNTAINTRTTNVLRAQVSVILGQAQAEVALNVATANAKSFQTIEAAKSAQFAQLRQQEAQSYQKLQQSLNLNDTSLLKYRYSQLISTIEAASHTNEHFIVGFKSPIITLSP